MNDTPKNPTAPSFSGPKIQARLTLPENLRAIIEPLRAHWDPKKSQGNPAHVTLIYQTEVPHTSEIEDRVRRAARDTKPFELMLAEPALFDPPLRGIYLKVHDPASAIADFRQRALTPPAQPKPTYERHVTLLHPSAGDRLEAAWSELKNLPTLGSFRVEELQIVDASNAVLNRFPLA